METIAVYWESRIKTYGFNTLNNLSLFEFNFPDERIAELEKVISIAHFQNIKSKFMILQKQKDGVSFIFCLSEEDGGNFRSFLKTDANLESYAFSYPVGILFFHGPHFGDRYGIAEAAFSPLLEAGIKIVTSGCSSSSVFFVMAENDLKTAQELLAKTFDSAK
jgi:aspartokinase